MREKDSNVKSKLRFGFERERGRSFGFEKQDKECDRRASGLAVKKY